MFAVIETGGKQYLVKPGQTLTIEKIEGEINSEISFDNVLLVGSEDGADVQIGTPYLASSAVKAKVLDQGRTRKLRVVKYKRKVRYKRVFGHRQEFTKVEITSIA